MKNIVIIIHKTSKKIHILSKFRQKLLTIYRKSDNNSISTSCFISFTINIKKGVRFILAGERTPYEKPPIRRLFMIITKNDYYTSIDIFSKNSNINCKRYCPKNTIFMKFMYTFDWPFYSQTSV